MWNPFLDEGLSWYTFDHKNDEENFLAEQIIRYATVAFIDIFDIDPDMVSVMNLPDISGIELVRLTEKDGQRECYGLFEKKEKFHVLDNLDSFDVLNEYDFQLNSSTLMYSWTTYSAKNALIQSPYPQLLVFDQYLPVSNWEICVNYIQQALVEHLRDDYPHFFHAEAVFGTFWKTKLEFSEYFELVEVRFHYNGLHRRVFLLVNSTTYLSDEIESNIVDGSSAIIHDIWAKSQESQISYFALETQSQIETYLRFFCWAVEGNEGHFLVVEKFTDFPWKSYGERYWDDVDTYVKTPWIVSVENDGAVIHNVHVAYGEALFSASFEIRLEDGNIAMVDDTSIKENLPLKPERVLGDLSSLPEILPEVLAEKKTFDDRITSVKTEEKFAEDFHSYLLFHDHADGFLVKASGTREYIEVNQFEKTTSIVTIRNCVFEHKVRLANNEQRFKIVFENCIFLKPFDADDTIFNSGLFFYNCDFLSAKGFNVIHEDNAPKPPVTLQMHNTCIKGDLVFENCRFLGLVNLTNIHVSGDICFNACYFTVNDGKIENIYSKKDGIEYLNRENIYIDNVTSDDLLDACYYIKPLLDLENADIAGDLVFSGQIQEGLSLYKCTLLTGSMYARGISVGGNLKVHNICIAGSLDMSNAIIGKDVIFNETQYDYDREHWKVDSAQVLIMSYVSFRNGQIFGKLDLSYAEVGSLECYVVRIGAYLLLNSFKCNYDINLRFAKINAGIEANREGIIAFPERKALYVGENFCLSNANVGSILLLGVYIRKALQIDGGHFGEIIISVGTSSKKGVGIIPETSVLGGLMIRSTTIDINLDLSGINILTKGERAEIIQKTFEEHWKELDYKGCQITTSKIGGSLLFFKTALFKKIEEHLNKEQCVIEYHRAAIWGGADITGNEIGGDLDLRNISVSGRIRLNETSVKRDVKLKGFYTQIDGKLDKVNLGDISNGINTPELSETLVLTESECFGLTMHNLNCGGDVNLTGLRMPERYNIDSTEMVIAGGFYLIADAEGNSDNIGNKDKIACMAKMDGNLDLSRSTIKNVCLTEDNFVNTSKKEHQEINLWKRLQNKISKVFDNGRVISDNQYLINMERCMFGKLRIVDPTPQAINLGGMKVSDWDFGQESDADNARNYKDILNKGIKFDQGVYLDIERDLRNRSRTTDADKIYISMRCKARYNLLGSSWSKMLKAFKGQEHQQTHNNSNRPFRILFFKLKQTGNYLMALMRSIVSFVGNIIYSFFDWLNRIFTSYGTTFIRLLLLWSILLCVMTKVVYENRTSIIADEATEITKATTSGQDLPVKSDEDAFLFAAQNSIPFFELKLIEAKPGTSYMRFWLLGSKVMAYILLSFAIFGYSSNIGRGKQ